MRNRRIWYVFECHRLTCPQRMLPGFDVWRIALDHQRAGHPVALYRYPGEGIEELVMKSAEVQS